MAPQLPQPVKSCGLTRNQIWELNCRRGQQKFGPVDVERDRHGEGDQAFRSGK